MLHLSSDTYATGGAGEDVFELSGSGASVIADFDAAQDDIVLVYPPRDDGSLPEVQVQDDGADALVLVDGQLMARVTGAAGLAADQIQLRAE